MVVGSHEGEDFHVNAAPLTFNTNNGHVGCLVKVKQGARVHLMRGTKGDVKERTARVARHVVRNSGFDVDSVCGAFSFMCGMNYFLSGDDGMQHLAERLSDVLGWVPTLGMCGGPEFGIIEASSCTGVGNYMYSAVVFSNQCVDEKASGVTFVNSAAEEMVRRRGSTVTGQLVSNKQVHHEEEDTRVRGLAPWWGGGSVFFGEF